MPTLTDVTIVLDHLGKREIRFVTAMPYRRVVLRVLSIMRDEAESDEYNARLVYAELAHFAVFPGDDVKTEFHVTINLHDYSTFIGHNEDRDSWGNVHFGGHTDDIKWDNSSKRNGNDWLCLMDR